VAKAERPFVPTPDDDSIPSRVELLTMEGFKTSDKPSGDPNGKGE
jgi:hypothetical protein